MTLLESLQDVSVLVLTENHSIKPFDCEDDDLNEFLFQEAIPFYQRMGFEFLSNTDKDDTTRLMFLDLTSFI